jgi:lipooligosaccharide transport system ATP-binding protein
MGNPQLAADLRSTERERGTERGVESADGSPIRTCVGRCEQDGHLSGDPPGLGGDLPCQSPFAIEDAESLLHVAEHRLHLYDEQRPGTCVESQEIDRPALSVPGKRDLRQHQRAVIDEPPCHRVHELGMSLVSEPVEAFALPHDSRDEPRPERFDDRVETTQGDWIQETTFDATDLGLGTSRANGKVRLAPPPTDSQQPQIPADPMECHGGHDLDGRLSGDLLTGPGGSVRYHRPPMSQTLTPSDSAREAALADAGPARRDGGQRDVALIEARGLTKKFGDFTAVDSIDFEVARGESFGFLGPNGAGKTSTMRMIGCVSPITAGSLTVLGMDPTSQGAAIKARLGVVPQQDTLDMELTVRENLIIYGRYFDLSRREAKRRADELLEFVQLIDRADSQVEPLSGGMKRRLTIARSLINEPDLLLLDEPTTGLDPQARHLLWDRLYRLKQQGKTLILTTHYMDEAEQLCDRLVVMDKARIVAEGSPRQLIDEYSTREVVELRFPVGVQQGLDGQLEGLADRIEHLPDRVLLYTDDGEAATAAAHERGLRPETVLVRRSTLEDVFLRLTGRSLIE